MHCDTVSDSITNAKKKSWPESEIFPKAALEPIGTAAAHSPGEMLLPLIAAGQVLKHGNEAGYG